LVVFQISFEAAIPVSTEPHPIWSSFLPFFSRPVAKDQFFSYESGRECPSFQHFFFALIATGIILSSP